MDDPTAGAAAWNCDDCRHPAAEHERFEEGPLGGGRGFCNADDCGCTGFRDDGARLAAMAAGAGAALLLAR